MPAADIVISGDDPIEGTWNGFRFQIAREPDFPAMLEHVRYQFCKDEPLCNFYKSSQSAVDGVVEFGRIGMSASPHSLVAYDQSTGEVAGVRISRMLRKDEPDAAGHEKSDKYYGDFAAVFVFMDRISEKVKPVANLFEKHSVDKIYQYRILSVGDKFRQRGLALELCIRSLRLAKREGCHLATAFFSSKFSRRVGVKLGFQVEAEIKYDEYEQDGKIVYTNMGVHEMCTLMSKTL